MPMPHNNTEYKDLEALIDQTSKITDRLTSMLLNAIKLNQKVEVFEDPIYNSIGLMLRKKSANAEEIDSTYIFILAIAIYKNLVNEAGASSQQTALHRAAAHNNSGKIDMLRRAGAETTLFDSKQKTPLDHATTDLSKKALTKPIFICDAHRLCQHDIDSQDIPHCI